MDYFCQEVLEILKNNQLKSYFGNSEIEMFSLFYFYATNGYCDVSKTNLNIWLDIHSKYIENFCVIVSVAVGILSERLTDCV